MRYINKGKLSRSFLTLSICLFSILLTSIAAQAQVPKPSDVFGFKVGADYKAANYDQIMTYLTKLDASSERVKMVNIGKSTDGRPMVLLFISTKENLQKLSHWRDISEKLARARIDSSQARQLSRDGKAIVWIDGGMHASEMAHGQMTSLLAYRVATDQTPQMQHIRDNVIFMLMPVMNPDGLDMVVNWYKKYLDTPYEGTGVPRLWQRYVGHDNNRDWFMGNMEETKNVLDVWYQKWFPQIIYNQHQSSPAYTRIFIPPFASPLNPNINPGVTAGVNEVGSAMLRRFALKDMPGVIANSRFTMWWDGGGRTVPFFHNQIGILSETRQASPTPTYYDPEKKPEYIDGIPTDGTAIFYPDPWDGGWLHFRDAVDYMITGSIAVLSYAADRHTDLLWGIYTMGRDAIQKGTSKDPYAFIIPKKQWDDWETKNMINALYRGGLEIKKATRDFTADGKQYKAGSYILYSAQSFRPYLMDMLMPQNYPAHPQYPDGPPMPTYDIAGWTLPMQMGVNVQKIEKPFQAPAKNVASLVTVNPSQITGKSGYGFIIDDRSNASMTAINALLGSGAKVSRTTQSHTVDGINFAAGSYIVTGAKASAVNKYGLSIARLPQKPDFKTVAVERPKVVLYKAWGGHSDEGWTDWMLQQYKVDVDTLRNKEMLNNDFSEYQSIIIPWNNPSFILNGYSEKSKPKQFTGGLGKEGTKKIEKFVKSGGTLICFARSSWYALQQFDLPVDIEARSRIDNKEFYLPGSLVKTIVDTSDPLGFGMQDTVASMYRSSYSFSVDKQAESKGRADVIARFADDNIVMSGGGIGVKKYLGGKAAVVRVSMGKGQIVLFGIRPQWRGQTRATYKLIFNAIVNATMDHIPGE